MTRRAHIVLTLIALGFGALHLAALPRTLEDEDSINFALGVEDFSIASHRPHPPGYPVYIALGKISHAVLTRVAPGWDRDRRAAAGLAIWSVLAGTVGIWIWWWFWSVLGLSPPVAIAATAASTAAPLYWFSAGRPLSDTPGLVAALAVQAAILHGVNEQRSSQEDAVPVAWWWAAVGAGLAIGLRSQTMWLTLPLLGWAWSHLLWRRQWRPAVGLVCCGLAGVVVWAVPLLWTIGGPGEYLAALRSQASQDFSSVEMLALSPTWPGLWNGLMQTFVEPWRTMGWPIAVLALAGLGLMRLVRGRARTGLILALAYGPYLVFHLLFQEVETLRYSLPFAAIAAGLAVAGLGIAGQRVGLATAAAVVAACVLSVQPALFSYAQGAPVFRGLQQMQRAWSAEDAPPILSAHHDPWWGTGRAFDWYRGTWDAAPPTYPGDRETLRLARFFLSEPERSAWFLANPSQHDLARFDPRTTIQRGSWELPSGVAGLIGGLRQYDLSWWTIAPPFWMLGTGWSLTPDLDRVTVAEGKTPSQEPAEAFVRRTSEPAHLMVGYRNLGSQAAHVTLTIDDRPAREWTAVPHTASAEWIDLPDGIPLGAEPYATIRLTVAGGDVRFDQFDATPVTGVSLALARGWSPLEKDSRTGTLGRWTTRQSTVEVRTGGNSVRLEIEGETPQEHFASPPRVLIWTGSHFLTRLVPESEFSLSVPLSLEDLAAGAGQVTIAVDLARTPAERAQGRARRTRGLRLTKVAVVRNVDVKQPITVDSVHAIPASGR